VEVRKILKEARQVAEGITIPEKGLFAKESELKILRDSKKTLIGKIEKAQFRAGDFSTASSTEQPWNLALAQAKYGNVQEAVKAAAREQFGSTVALDDLLLLMDELIRTGAMQAAITVAENDVAKERVPDSRLREQATVLSLIARRQYEKGDPAAPASLQRALQAAQTTKNLEDKFLALIHVARAQAVMGDPTASAVTFRQASQAAVAQEKDIEKAHALRQIAKAQAESGDRAASEETFQQAFQFGNKVAVPSVRAFVVGCLAWAQVTSGQRTAGRKKFQQALSAAESLTSVEKRRVLAEIATWQAKVGDQDEFLETLQRLRDAGSSMDARVLAARAGYLRTAIDLLDATEDISERIGGMRSLTHMLVAASERDGIQPASLIKRFAREAPILAKQATFSNMRKAEFATKDIAVIQAAAGDLPAALRTIESISRESFLSGYVYPEVIQVLIAQGNLEGARQVAVGLKKDWILSSMGALRDLAKLGVRSGDVQGTLAWARQRTSPYSRGYALLGVAEELMEQKRIEDLGKLVPEIRWRENCPSTESS
jgi:hypothetical protein